MNRRCYLTRREVLEWALVWIMAEDTAEALAWAEDMAWAEDTVSITAEDMAEAEDTVSITAEDMAEALAWAEDIFRVIEEDMLRAMAEDLGVPGFGDKDF